MLWSVELPLWCENSAVRDHIQFWLFTAAIAGWVTITAWICGTVVAAAWGLTVPHPIDWALALLFGVATAVSAWGISEMDEFDEE